MNTYRCTMAVAVVRITRLVKSVEASPVAGLRLALDVIGLHHGGEALHMTDTRPGESSRSLAQLA
jgi:hypothetical protein